MCVCIRSYTYVHMCVHTYRYRYAYAKQACDATFGFFAVSCQVLKHPGLPVYIGCYVLHTGSNKIDGRHAHEWLAHLGVSCRAQYESLSHTHTHSLSVSLSWKLSLEAPAFSFFAELPFVLQPASRIHGTATPQTLSFIYLRDHACLTTSGKPKKTNKAFTDATPPYKPFMPE